MKLDNVEIRRKLKERLGVIDLGILEGMYLSEVVVPVTQVDPLMAELKAVSGNQNLNVAVAWTGWLTVPDNRRWKTVFIGADSTTGNSMLGCIIGGVTVQLTALGTGGSLLWQELELGAGDSLLYYTTNNAGDGAINHRIIYWESKIR